MMRTMMNRSFFLIAEVLFLLVGVIVQVRGQDGDNDDKPYAGTTLEQLMTRAYNARVADGTWDDTFGDMPDIHLQAFCNGATDDWPIPPVESGTDLERVVQAGVFKCGYVQNADYKSTNGETLIASGEESDTVQGLVVDYWNSMVNYASNAIGEDINLEWTLYSTSQEVLDALKTGVSDGIDAACGRWSPYGTYDDSDLDEEVARSVVFSYQTCPTYLQDTIVYTPSDGGATTFEELLAAIDDGDVSDICVTGTPNGGTEANCQYTMNLYTEEDDSVSCTGFGGDAFTALDAGDACEAVYGGVPPTTSSYNRIVLPSPYSPVTFFRQKDLPPEQVVDEEPFVSSKTSLELAITKSFGALVNNGQWGEVFGDIDGIDPSSFCYGDDDSWPDQEPTEGSDLQAVIDRGTFRCGYSLGFRDVAPDGTVLIDSTQGNNTVTGIIADFWETVVAGLSDNNGEEIALEWTVFETSQDTFDAVYNNEADSACGFWLPDGHWTDPVSNQQLARPLAFSMFQCPIFYKTSYIYTASNTQINRYVSLVAAIDRINSPIYICVADDEAGGVVSLCQNELNKSTAQGQPICRGAPAGTPDASAWAFQELADESCTAVWGGMPSDPSGYNSFPQPTKQAPTSFFRTFDAALLQATTSPVTVSPGTEATTSATTTASPTATTSPSGEEEMGPEIATPGPTDDTETVMTVLPTMEDESDAPSDTETSAPSDMETDLPDDIITDESGTSAPATPPVMPSSPDSDSGCPKTTGSCDPENDPVKCGLDECEYENICWALSAGYRIDECLPISESSGAGARSVGMSTLLAAGWLLLVVLI